MKRYLMATMLPVAAAVSASVYGADGPMHGVYGAVSAGRTEARDACDQFRAAFPTATECDQSSTGWRVTLGYRVMDFVGLELEYARFGEIDAAANIGGSTVQARAKGDGVGLLLVGNVPLGERLELFAKGGLFNWEVEAEDATGTADADGYDPTFGAGARFRLGGPLWAQIEWRRYRDVGDRNVTGESDVDFVSFGIELRQR